jgi:hypothetical protein
MPKRKKPAHIPRKDWDDVDIPELTDADFRGMKPAEGGPAAGHLQRPGPPTRATRAAKGADQGSRQPPARSRGPRRLQGEGQGLADPDERGLARWAQGMRQRTGKGAPSVLDDERDRKPPA